MERFNICVIGVAKPFEPSFEPSILTKVAALITEFEKIEH